MTAEQARRLEDWKAELHISHSQISTYLNCSLKYYFSYVEGRLPEQRPAPLAFGSAVHAAIGRYYKSLKEHGAPDPLSVLLDVFSDDWAFETEDSGIPMTYKDGSNRESMLADGQRLVKVFHQSVRPMQVVAVEEPLSAVLYDEEGKPTDMNLIGIIDCIQRDEQGKLLTIDHKTANRAYTDDKVEQDMQMTVYSYLCCASKLVPPKAETFHRFDVLVKNKKEPRLEFYPTKRTAAQRKRLAKVISRVLKGIEGGVFFPSPSWMCSDCQYAQACVNWSL
jgi:putative RecB family exonuclease